MVLALLWGGLLVSMPAAAADWPQWLGPARDGVASQDEQLAPWGEDGPREAWRVPGGGGYAGMAIADGRLFTAYARGDEEWAVALDAVSGKELWQVLLGPVFREQAGGPGPRSTPTVDGDRVYVLGAQGYLHALRVADGKSLWSVDYRGRFDAETPQFGFAGSPLIEGDLLVVEVGGGRGKQVAALDKMTGETVWTAGDDKAGYASPIGLSLDRRRQVVVFGGSGLAGIDLKDGKVLWTYPWRTEYDISAATPVWVAPDRLFISTGYDTGGTLIRLEGNRASQVWKNRELRNHFATSISYGGYLYGFDESTLKCVDLKDGSRVWRQRGFGKGSLIIAGGYLVVLGDKGNLVLAEAAPTAYRQVASAQVLQGRCWVVPSVAGGRLYVRDDQEIVCLDLRTVSQVQEAVDE
jgi:outer membrane protein assembly factor BamB